MKKLITFLLFATVAASCFGQSKKQTAMSPDAGMVSLMNEAKQLMRYRDEIALPDIQPATEQYLKSLVCEGIKYCPVSAVYFNNTVYYKQDLNLNDTLTKSILIHEFIHHIQANSGFLGTNCNVWYGNEKEAYRLQAKYLRNNDQDDGFIHEALRIIKCK
jgi:hypothetical protein